MKNLFTIVFALLVSSAMAQVTPLTVGAAAPDIRLKNVDGKTVSFADYPKAKGFIVVFTCNTCPVAKAYEQRVIGLDAKLKSQGYPVIAINANDPEASAGDAFAEMQTRAKAKKYTFPYLFDPGQTVTDAYGATKTPHLFIVQKTEKGNIIAYTGAIDNDQSDSNPAKVNYVEDAVKALAANTKPAVASTKAIGCTVKRKS